MVKRIVTHYVDDLDGGEANETLTFGLDGVDYELDLSDHNAKEIRETMGRWVEKAHRIGGRKTTGRKPRKAPTPDE